MQLENSQTTFDFRKVHGPLEIHSLEKGMFQPAVDTGLVLPGNWDRYRKEYRFDRIYRGLKAHFDGDASWEDTEYGRDVARVLQLSEYPYDSVDEYFAARIRPLYESIAEHGYRTDVESGDEAADDQGSSGVPVTRDDYVGVNVGRNGELIFNNHCHHRFAVSKILDVDEIPAIAVVRHEQWQELRREVEAADAVDDLSERARANLDHPDLRPFVDDDWH